MPHKKEQPTPQPDLASSPQQVGIPNAKGAIRITGQEDLVKSFLTNNNFFKKLQAEVDADKKIFRQHAADAVAQLKGDVKRVEFVDETGNSVSVTVPDYDKTGNRSPLGEDVVALAEQLLDMTGLIEETREIHITDPELVKWFIEGVINKHYPEGTPAGLELKVTKRLTASGISKLYALANHEDPGIAEAAKLLLKSGRKAFSVG